MNNFGNQQADIVKKAKAYITSVVKKHNKIVLLDLLDENYDEDALYDLPIVSHVGKHGDYQEYAILDLQFDNGEVLLHTKGKDECGDEETFDLSEADHICFLADTIEEFLTEKKQS